MSSATQYLQKKLLDHLLGVAEFTMSTTYLGLFISSPGETGSLSGEVTGGSYARVELSSKMAATVLATGVAVNNTSIQFPLPTADWGAVGHWGVLDSATLGAGNVLFYGELFSTRMVVSGALPPELAVGSFSISAPSAAQTYVTRYAAKKLLDHALGIASYAMPAPYLALFSGDPGGTGSVANEIAIGSYGRQPLTGLMGAAVLETGISSLADTVQFPVPTADYDVTYVGVVDAPSAGNVLLRKARNSTLHVVVGGAGVRYDPGKLTLQAA